MLSTRSHRGYLLAIAVIFLSPLTAYADEDSPDQTSKVTLRAGAWNYTPTGTVSDGGDELRLQEDLGVEEQTQGHVALRIPTAKARWPSISATFDRIDIRGSKRQQGSFRFGPIVFNGARTVTTRGRVRDHCLGFDWSLARWVEGLRAGFRIRQLRGQVVVRDESTGDESREKVDALFPLLGLAFSRDIADALNLDLAVDWAQASGNSALDAQAIVGYRWGHWLQIEGGYRLKSVDFSQGDYRVDAEFDGAFIGLSLRL